MKSERKKKSIPRSAMLKIQAKMEELRMIPIRSPLKPVLARKIKAMIAKA